MKKDIIFAGVGGQGIISIAAMLTSALMKKGFKCKQTEVHGMSQRGGDVSCGVRFSTDEIFSDIIPRGGADIILATEPMEALRFTDFLRDGGVVISANQPVKNIPYPELGDMLATIKKIPNSIVVDTEKLTVELKNPRVMNIAMLAALIKVLGMEDVREMLVADIKKRFAAKGDSVIEANIKAIDFGMNSVC